MASSIYLVAPRFLPILYTPYASLRYTPSFSRTAGQQLRGTVRIRVDWLNPCFGLRMETAVTDGSLGKSE